MSSNSYPEDKILPESLKSKPGQRRLAREIALRILFLYEVTENVTATEAYSLFISAFSPQKDEENIMECETWEFDRALPFARELYFGVTSSLEELDECLGQASQNWRLDRMSRVDRNVMRLAVFEMLHRQDVPYKVSINEAIDLGKSYGAEDSGAFVNGVLDRIHKQLRAAGKDSGGAGD